MLGVNGSSAVLTVPCSGETSKHHKTLPALTLMTDYYYAHTHTHTRADARKRRRCILRKSFDKTI